MPALTDEVKIFIVRSLASFNTPSEVSEQVKEEFGLEVDRAQVARYDPTKPLSAKLGAKYKAIFEASRKNFLEDISQIPMANAAVRISKLSKMAEEALKRKNNVLAANHIEQIAREVGGAYTNKLKLAGGDKGDNPLSILLGQLPGSGFKPVADEED